MNRAVHFFGPPEISQLGQTLSDFAQFGPGDRRTSTLASRRLNTENRRLNTVRAEPVEARSKSWPFDKLRANGWVLDKLRANGWVLDKLRTNGFVLDKLRANRDTRMREASRVMRRVEPAT